MQQTLHMCRKCLLEQISEEKYWNDLRTYIENLDESDRVSQKSYEQRLALCGSCAHLQKGMCRLCGCFVELRAALRVRKCPDLPARWERETEREEADEQ